MFWSRRKPGLFFWKLFFGNAALMAVLLGASAWIILDVIDQFYTRELTAYLESHARLLAAVVSEDLGPARAQELAALAEEVGASKPPVVRVTFVDINGTVLGDSEADPRTMESHADRPEIQQALATGLGKTTRWSHTVNNRLQYLAVRIGTQNTPQGVVRVALPVQTIRALIGPTHRVTWTILGVGLVASVMLALGLARLWSRRIAHLTMAARSLSRGHLDGHIETGGRDEIALLAKSLNRMRDNLARQLETIDRHRREFESLLGQLHEGVIVAYPNGRIMLLNPAAAILLDLPQSVGPTGARDNGPVIEECVHRFELQRMLRPTTTEVGQGPVNSVTEVVVENSPGLPAFIHETRLELPCAKGNVSVLARASDIALPGYDDTGSYVASGGRPFTGRLLVLTDITEITRAIQIKTDFVANASHELRTPLSAIRAAVDTVLNLNLAEEESAARQFLQVVHRHSARLEALVEDLLVLSRLETSADRIQPATLNLRHVFQQLQERWSPAAEEGNIQLACRLAPDTHEVVADGHLLQLILDNLVDNAIKFTSAGGHVTVEVRRESDRLAIVVSDDGCGIAAEEHQRVFERFYQVERARSGTGSRRSVLRGTGLGLSIVRHAALAMEGTVTLASQVGSGTHVTLSIPRKPSSSS